MKVLFVVAPSNFRDEELFQTKEVLESSGISVEIASTRKGIAKGMLGGRVEVSKLVSEVNVLEYDGVVFVGGSGVEEHLLYENKDIISLAKKAYANKKVVAAICIAPRILARAGILTGKKATVFPDKDSIAILEGVGVVYIPSAVVVDEKIVTANGPTAARSFGDAIVSVLKK